MTDIIVTTPEALRELVREVVRAEVGAQRPAAKLLTPEEAGAVLGVHPRTVLRWTKTHGLPHRVLGARVIRFVEAELLGWDGGP